ncbi:LPXTG-motif cell wall anchor domain protein [Striga asiatica]|uniref:LPXTG-motif cell wall anchor domain protein n=1 Tax=Striga asiatica TaxID=4170 RepID=A0A5A7PES6_STRAF|nr:LPXTG-motif cell wall anchor domain protein [Striga asiatica]
MHTDNGPFSNNRPQNKQSLQLSPNPSQPSASGSSTASQNTVQISPSQQAWPQTLESNDPAGKSKPPPEPDPFFESLYKLFISANFSRIETIDLSAASRAFWSTSGTCAAWNWRYEASNEETVARSEGMRARINSPDESHRVGLDDDDLLVGDELLGRVEEEGDVAVALRGVDGGVVLGEELARANFCSISEIGGGGGGGDGLDEGPPSISTISRNLYIESTQKVIFCGFVKLERDTSLSPIVEIIWANMWLD